LNLLLSGIYCLYQYLKFWVVVEGYRPLFSSPNSPPNFTMQKEDSLSHQNIGKCMEY
jgi:hypothetical protein